MTPEEMQRTHELVQQVLALSDRMRRHYVARAEELDLTAPQAQLLLQLSSGPAPMGELAGRLRCDASNITGLTDRLEKRGMVQRGAAPTDRRVTLLAITGEGLRLHEALWQRLMADSPVARGLSEEQLDQLLAILQALDRDE